MWEEKERDESEAAREARESAMLLSGYLAAQGIEGWLDREKRTQRVTGDNEFGVTDKTVRASGTIPI